MKLVDPDKPWFVLRCFTGREREAAYELHRLGYDAYCPAKRVNHIHRRTNIKTIKEEILWPGYIFVAQPRWNKELERFHEDFATPKDDVDGVIDFLRPSKWEAPFVFSGKAVLSVQIDEMNMEFDETDEADAHRGIVKKTAKEQAKVDFPEGSMAEIIADLWEGHLGKVIEHTKTGHIKLAIQALGGTFTLDTRAEKLRPAA